MKTDLGQNLRVIHNLDLDLDLPREREAYYEIYSSETRGDINYIGLRFNSEKVLVRLTIDDVEIFEIDVEDLEDIFGYESDDIIKSGSPIAFNRDRNMFELDLRQSVQYLRNFKIEAKANSNSSGRDLESYLIVLSNQENI